jgi:uncharacterized damage-inducible protein DinB
VTTLQPDVATLFIDFSRRKLFDQYWSRMRATVEPLTEEQVWWRPNEASNSIGNLLLHLNGNVYQWLVASFNQLKDERNRSAEFAERGEMPASVLLNQLGATMDQARMVLDRLTQDDLLARYEIQGYHVSGLDAVYQVVEHFGLHYGQVLYIAKSLGGADLGFYSNLNATGRVPAPPASPQKD